MKTIENTEITRVLMLVDDNPLNLQLLQANIEATNFDCFILTHENSQELFVSLRSVIPDIFLLDVCMPNETGFDIAKKLKSNKLFKDIPIIFITSLDNIDDIMKGYDLGAVKYMSIPGFLQNTESILKSIIN